MSRGLKNTAVVVAVLVIVFAAAQLVRPERANPASDPSHAIQAQAGTTSELAAVLDRACRDCHSNATVWSSYTQVAPVSWVIAYAVKEGRAVVNFSDWSSYPPAQQRALLAASCNAVSTGKMPGEAYTFLYPQARLSAHDVETVCAAAR